jgi:excisionase family DNA binding protein
MPETLYTLKEVMDILKVSQATAYRMVSTGRLPHVRIGRLVRIPANVIDEMIKKGVEETTPKQDTEE